MGHDTKDSGSGFRAYFSKALRSKSSSSSTPKSGTRLTKKPPPGITGASSNSRDRDTTSSRQLSRSITHNGTPSVPPTFPRPSTAAGPTKTLPPLPQTVKNDPPMTLELHRQKYAQTRKGLDTQLGEIKLDDTTLLHSLAKQDSLESFTYAQSTTSTTSSAARRRPKGEDLLPLLPPALWSLIATYLSPLDAANLAISSPTLLSLLGGAPLLNLEREENHPAKIAFLRRNWDHKLPHHLLCFACAKFHLRLEPGIESLRPKGRPNPIYLNCSRQLHNRRADLAITPRLALPYPLAMLISRAHRFHSLAYGIAPGSLARRWGESAGVAPPGGPQPGSGWRHDLRFHIHPPNHHLLMRVTSSHSVPSPPGPFGGTTTLPASMVRLLLFNREDYVPYFSTCAHWSEGVLIDVCKCALGHATESAAAGTRGQGPKAVARRVYSRMEAGVGVGGGGGMRNRGATPGELVSLCGFCKPMRRCVKCATEYLVEVRLVEDRSRRRGGGGGGANGSMGGFQQSLVITRWSDLGDVGMRDPVGGDLDLDLGLELGHAHDSSTANTDTKTRARNRRQQQPRLGLPIDEWHACITPSAPPPPTSPTSATNRRPPRPRRQSSGNDTTRKPKPKPKPKPKKRRHIYDSFATIGKRSLAGWFESARAEEQIPGQRILSLDPNHKGSRRRRPPPPSGPGRGVRGLEGDDDDDDDDGGGGGEGGRGEGRDDERDDGGSGEEEEEDEDDEDEDDEEEEEELIDELDRDYEVWPARSREREGGHE